MDELKEIIVLEFKGALDNRKRYTLNIDLSNQNKVKISLKNHKFKYKYLITHNFKEKEIVKDLINRATAKFAQKKYSTYRKITVKEG